MSHKNRQDRGELPGAQPAAQRWMSFGGRGQKNLRRPDDRISEDVCRRLTDDPDIDERGIHVQVQDAEVTLSGTVEDRRMKWAAEDAATHVQGVREVRNEIHISLRPRMRPRPIH